MVKFTEDSRVKIPTILHLIRLGYGYISKESNKWDEATNIFSEIFKESIVKINEGIEEGDAQRLLEDVKLALENEDLGKAFYEKLTADERFSFFGLEVELWKIGNSPAAPKFNIVNQPNNWSKTVAQAAKNLDNQETSETKGLQYRYWQNFTSYLENSSSKLRPQAPSPKHWLTFSIGRSGFHVNALLNTVTNRIGVELVIADKDGEKAFYHLLVNDKEIIEREMGSALEWRENPEKNRSSILLFFNANPAEDQKWNLQHDWLKNSLEKFDTVFRQRIRNL